MTSKDPSRRLLNDLLEEWSHQVLSSNRGSLRELGHRSWLGELVKNNNAQNNVYTPPPVPTDRQQELVTVLEDRIRTLSEERRSALFVEYLTPRKSRSKRREDWLAATNRTHGAHRKMISLIKDDLVKQLIAVIDHE